VRRFQAAAAGTIYRSEMTIGSASRREHPFRRPAPRVGASSQCGGGLRGSLSCRARPGALPAVLSG
jgi:hypothetical protein